MLNDIDYRVAELIPNRKGLGLSIVRNAWFDAPVNLIQLVED